MPKLDAIYFANEDELSAPGIDIRLEVWRIASCVPIALNASTDRTYLCGVALSCSEAKGMSVMSCDGYSLQVHEGFASGQPEDDEMLTGCHWLAPMDKGVFISRWSPLFRELKLKKHLKHWFRIKDGRASITEQYNGGAEYASSPVGMLMYEATHVGNYAETNRILDDLRDSKGELEGKRAFEFGVSPKTFTLAAGITDPNAAKNSRGYGAIKMRVVSENGPVALTRPSDKHYFAAMMPVNLK